MIEPDPECTVVIEVKGGCVVDYHTTGEVNVIVVDHDAIDVKNMTEQEKFELRMLDRVKNMAYC